MHAGVLSNTVWLAVAASKKMADSMEAKEVT